MTAPRAVSAGMLRWRTAAAELAPEKSLARLTANAKYVVTTVAVVGTALSAFGVVSASASGGRPGVRPLTLVAVALAAAAVAIALASLVLRTRAVNLENLLEVKDWYDREYRRAAWITLAGWLLVAAVVGGALAGILSMRPAGPAAGAGILVTAGAVTVNATVDGLNSGDTVTIRLYRGDDLLLVASHQPDAAGAVKVSSTVEDAAGQAAYRLVVDGGGVHREVAAARP